MKVSQCEYCGDDLGYEVDKWHGEHVTCGKQECERYARDCAAEERERAHEELDEVMGWGGRSFL